MRHCRFLHQKLDCGASLVASACSETMASFYEALVKLQPPADDADGNCFAPVHSFEKFIPQGIESF